jgi:hypothetical protein
MVSGFLLAGFGGLKFSDAAGRNLQTLYVALAATFIIVGNQLAVGVAPQYTSIYAQFANQPV